MTQLPTTDLPTAEDPVEFEDPLDDPEFVWSRMSAAAQRRLAEPPAEPVQMQMLQPPEEEGGFARGPLGFRIDRRKIEREQLIRVRSSAEIREGISQVQEDRGYSAEFITEWSGFTAEQQRSELGNLLMSGPREEYWGEWLERLKGDRAWAQLVLKHLPLVEGVIDSEKGYRILSASRRYNAGNDDAADRTLLFSAIMDMKMTPAGWPTKAGQIATGSLPYMASFLLTRKVYVGASTATAKTLNNILGGMGRAGRVTAAIGGFGAGAAAQSVAANPGGIVAGQLQRMLPDFTIDEAGQLAMDMPAADGSWEALWGSATDNFVEFASENLGIPFNRGVMKLAMQSAMINRFMRMRKFRGAGPLSMSAKVKQRLTTLLSDSGYNGIVTEVLEERFGDIGRLATGEMTWEELIEKNGDWRNWAAEVMAFAMPVMAVQGAALGAEGIDFAITAEQRRRWNKENLGGQSRAQIAYDALGRTIGSNRPRSDDIERVPPTVVQRDLARIAERDGGTEKSVMRTYMLERGGPYTQEEANTLDLTDRVPDAQSQNAPTYEEVEAVTPEERAKAAEGYMIALWTMVNPADGLPIEEGSPMHAAIRQTLSQIYRVQRQLGEGGMFTQTTEPGLPMPDFELGPVSTPAGPNLALQGISPVGELSPRLIQKVLGKPVAPADMTSQQKRTVFQTLWSMLMTNIPLDESDAGLETQRQELGGNTPDAIAFTAGTQLTSQTDRDRAVAIGRLAAELFPEGHNAKHFAAGAQSTIGGDARADTEQPGQLDAGRGPAAGAAAESEGLERTSDPAAHDAKRLFAPAGDRGSRTLFLADQEVQATEYQATDHGEQALAEAGTDVVSVFELTGDNAPAVFTQLITEAKAANKHGAAVTVYDSYEGMRLFVTEDGLVGGAVNGDDMISLFKHDNAGRRGQAGLIMSVQIDAGGRRGDAFDTALPFIYTKLGMRIVARIPWDESQKPEGWEKADFIEWNNGEPDVVFFVHVGDATDVAASFGEREYIPGEGAMVSEWDDGVTIQTNALEQVGLAYEAPQTDAAAAEEVDRFRNVSARVRDMWNQFTVAQKMNVLAAKSMIDAPIYRELTIDGALWRMRSSLTVYGRPADMALVDPTPADGVKFQIAGMMQKFGVNFSFYARPNGERSGYLGYYDPNSDVIMLDFNLSGEEAVRKTFVHEFTHYLHRNRVSAWHRYRAIIRNVDEKGLRLAGLDYYRRMRVNQGEPSFSMDEFLLWYETEVGQNESVAVYTDNRMETTGFYDLIMSRDRGTFDAYRERLTAMIDALGFDHPDVAVLVGVKELADAFHEKELQLDELQTVDEWLDSFFELRGPESHSKLQAEGMRALRGMTVAKFEASGRIARPTAEQNEDGTWPDGSHITHREAKNDPDLAQYWALEMQKLIGGGMPATKEVIRVSGKLLKADDVMRSRGSMTAAFVGREDLVSPLVRLMIGREELDLKPTGKRGVVKVGDIGRALDIRARRMGQVIRFNEKGVRKYKGKQRERLIRSLMEEIQAGFASGSYNGAGWYDARIKEMIEWTARDFPELLVSDSHAAIFKYLVAITSNGNTVRRNYGAAKKIYAGWRKSAKKMTVVKGGNSAEAPIWGTGQFPTVNFQPTDADGDLIPMDENTKVPAGWTQILKNEVDGSLWSMRGWIVRGELIRLNKMMAREDMSDGSGTPQAFIEWLMEEMTVKEIRDDAIVGKKSAVSGELGTLKNRRVLYLGPKIGVFFQNMMGKHDLLTMDIWFARTWNRLTGTLMMPAKKKEKALQAGWEQAKGLPQKVFDTEPTKYSSEDIRKDRKVAIQWALQADRQIQARNGQDTNDRLKKAVTKIKNAHDGVVSDPGTGTERSNIRELFKEVQLRLQEYGKEHGKPYLKNLQMSDIQAVLWYNEQAFFQAFGVSKAQTASENFGDVAKRDFQESRAAGRRIDAETAIIIGGGRHRDGRGRGAVTGGAGGADTASGDGAVVAAIEASQSRPDGGIDTDLVAARDRLVDAGYTTDDATELIERAAVEVMQTKTRRLSVVIDALSQLPEKTVEAGLDLIAHRRPVTGSQQSLFVDTPVRRAARPRRQATAKMGPKERAALKRDVRAKEAGRRAGKRQGKKEGVEKGKEQEAERATARIASLTERVFGQSSGKASVAEVNAMHRAMAARSPEDAAEAAVSMIRASAVIARAKLHAQHRASEKALRSKGQQDVRQERDRGKEKARQLLAIKRAVLKVIRDSGLQRKRKSTFNADLVAASTPEAVDRALAKIERLAAEQRFEAAVGKYDRAAAQAKRAGKTSLMQSDRDTIRTIIQATSPQLYLPGKAGDLTKRRRSFSDAGGFDNATMAAQAATEKILDLLTERKEEKATRGKNAKFSRNEDVVALQNNLGYNRATDEYDKELKTKRHAEKNEDRERRLRLMQIYKDVESLTRDAERRHRPDNEVMGVLTRLISRNLKKAEDRYNSDLRDEMRVLEQFVRDAGFLNLSEAFQKLMGTFGHTTTDMVDLVIGGQTMPTTLDTALNILALDTDAMAKIAKGRGIKLRNMSQRQKLFITIEEIEKIRADYAQYQPMVDAMKARLENSIRPRLFAVIMRLKGAEPERIEGYFPTQADTAATDNAGLAKSYRDSGSFQTVLSKFLENLGFTKSRETSAGAESAPLVLNGLLAQYTQHIDQALKVIHMAEPTREASAVLLHPTTADAINRTGGTHMYNNLKTMLAESSLAGRDSVPGGSQFLQMANSNIASTYIITNPGTFIRQIGGIPKLWAVMPQKYFLIGLTRMFTRGNAKEMLDNSGFFHARYSGDSIARYHAVQGTTLDGVDNVLRLQAFSALVRSMGKGDVRGSLRSWNRLMRTIKLLDWFDALSARIAWEGYKQMGVDQGLSGKALMGFAADKASMAIRSTQNTSSPLDAGGIVMNTRESVLKYAFLFTTDPMKSLNMAIQARHDTAKVKSKVAVGIIANIAWSAYWTNLILQGGSELIGIMIAQLMGGEPDDKKQAERMLRDLNNMHFRALRDILGTAAPVWGDALANMITGIIRGSTRDPLLDAVILDSLNSILTSIVNDTVDIVQAIDEKDADDFLWGVIDASAHLATGVMDLLGNPLHMPYYRMRRMLEPAQDELPEEAARYLEFKNTGTKASGTVGRGN